MEKLAQAGDGGARPLLFTLFTIMYKVAEKIIKYEEVASLESCQN
jgi:hypothetical protein